MPNDYEFKSELPTQEEIEAGRRHSLFLGLIVGGIVVAVGIVAYLLFAKYVTF